MSSSPRTSSFFDTSSTTESPSPAPRWTPSKNPGPSIPSIPSPLSLSRSSSKRQHVPPPIAVQHTSFPSQQLLPLHQAPSTSVNAHWRPPLPNESEDVDLRFSPTPSYLLGQGRYAHVYLASYRTKSSQSRKLCAAKRMAPDRESQTMGLREAFFLNRLTAVNRRYSDAETKSKTGSVYVIKLIAVKEDAEQRRSSFHNRSTSDALEGVPRRHISRQRSSTFGMPSTDPPSPSCASTSSTSIVRPPPPVTTAQLVLLLEHAPLGSMDRLLRASPNLVGRALWERWACQCTEALAWVHAKGIVHADVKPANLLLTRNLDIRLSDFGSSLLIHSSQPPVDGVGLGTLPFSPPELVDPSQTFSFPIDIFALGATLYQCITGREPYRGCRSVEMMHHVRKGDLWVWEERLRIGRVGDTSSLNASPFPSAWRDMPVEGVRRGGSLRVPSSQARPSLVRMSSAESLRASDDVTETESSSPAGVKLWANWVKGRSNLTSGPIAALLGDDVASFDDAEKIAADLDELESRDQEPRMGDISTPYGDGSPRMIFLDGLDGLDQEWRDVLKEMVDPNPHCRPSAEDLRQIWGSMS